MQRPGFWDDQAKAAEISEQHARARRRVEGFRSLSRDVGDLGELAELAAEDEEMARELTGQLESVERRLGELEEERLFSGRFDAGDAVVTVNPGPAARNHKTGPRCSCACICAGPSGRVSRSR